MATVRSRGQQWAQTEVLDLAYEEGGPADGPPVLLAHGWPDSVRTWDRILPALHRAGYRTINYHQRGCGLTRFRHPSTLYSGQACALAADLLGLAQALGLERFAVIGHDWGAQAGYLAAALEPERISHLVALSSDYRASEPEEPLTLEQIQSAWYQWFFALPQATSLVKEQRAELARTLWRSWSPHWREAERDLNEAISAFDNPTWAAVTVHGFRHRWGLAAGDPRYREMETAMGNRPSIRVPTLTIQGKRDACDRTAARPPDRRLFSGPHRRLDLVAVGHFPQREAPARVTHAVLSWLRGEHPPEASITPEPLLYGPGSLAASTPVPGEIQPGAW